MNWRESLYFETFETKVLLHRSLGLQAKWLGC